MAFVKYFPGSRNAAEAALKAGFSPKTAAATGSDLLRNPAIQQLISIEVDKHSKKIGLEAEGVMRYWQDIAHAELPLPDVGACRYCYGEDHQYQYTLNESRQALRVHTAKQLKIANVAHRRPFDELGGIGFDKTRPPHPECPECNGVGVNHPMVIDRDKLTAGQRIALDEVRILKDGSVSLKMRDRSRAMENLQELMGMIKPRRPIEVLDESSPFEEQVDILLQTAIDRGLIKPPSDKPSPLMIEHEPPEPVMADVDD